MQKESKKLKFSEYAASFKDRKIGLGTTVLIVLVVAFGAYIAGTRNSEILAFVGLKQKTQSVDFSSLQNVYQALSDQFDGELDVQKLIDGAKRGLVESAGDPYTVYFTDEEAKEFLQELDGKFSGIGAELGKKDDVLTVVSTLDDSPALKSGLQAGDYIVKVNDQETNGWSIEKAVSQIRGEKGTTVKLTILRDQEVKDFSILREEIVNPSVKSSITEDNVGYMRISRFSDLDTHRLAAKAAKEFKDAGVKGIVLDLRGNGGGYLGAAQDIAGLWLKDKVVVEERTGDKVVETLRTDGSAILAGIPTIVLIDGGSASASEIVAGALNDYDAAILLGTKTFGKGSVQTIESIDGGGQLKVTVAKWYTPNGRNINKEGIEPDQVVEAGEDLANDLQKNAAFEKLR